MLLLRHHSGLTQALALCDIITQGAETVPALVQRVPKCARIVVYSDPPWNPGNEKWWRKHAGVGPPVDYNHLLDAWCRIVAALTPEHVFCEQSSIAKHRQFFLDAARRTDGFLPFLEQWTVFYGPNGRLPNSLLHFGSEPLRTDPSGMRAEPMTRRVFEGLDTDGTLIVDPCTGKGMSSRMAHYFGCQFVGTELNAKRLDFSVAWLKKQGYCFV